MKYDKYDCCIVCKYNKNNFIRVIIINEINVKIWWNKILKWRVSESIV